MSCNFKKKPMTFAIGYGLLSILANTAYAAAIEEVRVTAEKREENLQNTPIAMSALSSETLKNLGITSFEGVAKASPSISFTPYPSSSNVLILYMRGQGVSDPMQITSDGSVGLYEDGFYISRPQASTFDLADVERVEVLRGPQGTLYGRNTTGGAVNILSKKPSGEFGFKQDFSFGSRNLFRSLTTVDLPKWNDISTKFTILKSSKDGYVKNTGTSHDYGEEKQQAGRFSLRWEAAKNVTVDYFLEKGQLDSTPVYYQNASLSGQPITFPAPIGMNQYYADGGKRQTRTYRPADLDLSTSDSEGHGLTVAWDVNDALTIKSLTSYRKLNWHAFQDYADAFITLGQPTLFKTDDLVRDHQFSQEVQFIGNTLENRIKYVAGLYYFKEGASHGEILTSNALAYGAPGVGFPSLSDRYVTSDAKSQAAYGQVTWTPPVFDDHLDLTVGARYTKDNRSAQRDFTNNGVVEERGSTPILTPCFAATNAAPCAPNGAANDQSFKRFNPSFTANYNWTDDLSTYAKVSTGYKAGGSSESATPPNGDFTKTVFKPEKVVSYELGLKSYWLDRKVRLNTAVFESKFDDMQLAFVIDPTNNGVVQNINAGKATVKGLEVDLLLQPIDDLSFNVDYSYLKADFDTVSAPAGTIFDKVKNGGSPYNAGDNIKNLFVMPYAPKNTVGVGTDYTFFHFDRGNLTAHVDYRYQSKIYDTATAGSDVPGRENYAVPGYGLLNGRLTMSVDLPRGDKAKIGLWAKNIAHHEYKTQVTGNGGPVAVPALGTQAGFNSNAATWAEPASYGIDLSYQY